LYLTGNSLIDFCKLSISARKKGSLFLQSYSFFWGGESIKYKFIKDMQKEINQRIETKFVLWWLNLRVAE
jgi:hypothetical protein